MVDDGAGDGDALLLTSRQGAGFVVEPFGEPEHFDHFGELRIGRAASSGDVAGDIYVLPGRECRQ